MPGLIFGFLLLMGSCELLGKESLALVAASEDRLTAPDGRTPSELELAELIDATRDVGLVKYLLVDLGKVMVNNLSRV
jgi:hypothetical protein